MVTKKTLLTIAFGALLVSGLGVMQVSADDDEHEDADEPGPREELDDPLKGCEVADDGQPVVRLHQLEEGVDQRREEHEERERREPVRRRHHRQP